MLISKQDANIFANINSINQKGKVWKLILILTTFFLELDYKLTQSLFPWELEVVDWLLQYFPFWEPWNSIDYNFFEKSLIVANKMDQQANLALLFSKQFKLADVYGKPRNVAPMFRLTRTILSFFSPRDCFFNENKKIPSHICLKRLIE